MTIWILSHVLVILTFAGLEYFCDAEKTLTVADYPFRNMSLSWEQRVEDIVSRLTVSEMQGVMGRDGSSRTGSNPSSAILRLGIKPFQFSSECDRGAERAPSGNATNFPQDIGLAASFSTDLIFRVSEAAAIETRAKNNNYTKQNNYGYHTGLVCISPVLDLFRDPRWGRNQETHGEDPYMVGVFGAAFVRALQGDHPRYIRGVAACAHLAAYSGPENIPVSRMSFNAEISDVDLRMTFLPAFRACVDAGAYAVESSYNAINGVPVVVNKWLLTDLLRGEWGFKGFVLSDDSAVENVKETFHFINDTVDVVAAAVNAGCNVELSSYSQKPFYLYIEDAVKQGKIKESTLRDLVRPIFYTRMRLGEFDPPEMNPYRQYDVTDVVESTEHQALAVEAALKTFVLLKNNGILPFANGGRYDTISVVGPMANNTDQIQGDYAANTSPAYLTSPLAGLSGLSQHVKFSSGCVDTQCKSYDADGVKRVVSETELIYVLLGTGQAVEAEGHDRADLELPGYQKQLLLDVMDTANNTPIVLMLFSGGPVNVTFAEYDVRVSAIVQCFLPGQATGIALRHFVAGDVTNAVPAGRLPFTWPALASQVPPMTSYSMEGRTYRYVREPPLYPFGYGLSYVTFEYSALVFPSSVQAGTDLHGSVVVTNRGNMTADEVVQVYIDWKNSSLPAPRLQLVWFDRVTIPGGLNATVSFAVKASSMALWMDNKWTIPAGDMGLYVGGQQPNQTTKAPSNVLSGVFHVQTQLYE
ncbi:uncharacterized protein [Littorina saxatilis]|uniref:Fibronectin type III-like domain-containing protein n=1 Tax=Littorina saxatilis TaxID=31220 RepID=A0AAN9AKF7_9CAEN